MSTKLERLFVNDVLVRGDWHLIAYDNLRTTIRIVSLVQIEQWRIRFGERFVYPSAFSLDTSREGAFLSERDNTPETIVLQYDEYQARAIRERIQHPTQEPLMPLRERCCEASRTMVPRFRSTCPRHRAAEQTRSERSRCRRAYENLPGGPYQ